VLRDLCLPLKAISGFGSSVHFPIGSVILTSATPRPQHLAMVSPPVLARIAQLAASDDGFLAAIHISKPVWPGSGLIFPCPVRYGMSGLSGYTGVRMTRWDHITNFTTRSVAPAQLQGQISCAYMSIGSDIPPLTRQKIISTLPENFYQFSFFFYLQSELVKY